MNLQEAADVLQISPRRVRQLLDEGRLHARKLGRTWVVDEAEVRAFSRLTRRVGRRPAAATLRRGKLRPAEPSLKAFLSSVMNPRVEDLSWARRAAIEEIDLSPEFEAWAFEDTPGNSDDLDEAYLGYVDRSDCLLWLVGRETTLAVRAEVERAIKLRIRILIFRLTDDLTGETEALLKRVKAKWTRAEDVDGLRNGIRVTLEDELRRAYRRGRPASEIGMIDRLWRDSESRMLSRWLAADVSITAARELLAQADVPRVPDGVERDLANPVKLLVAGPGAGKSSVAERIHQQDIARYKTKSASPIPAFLPAAEVGTEMLEAVRRATNGLGDPEVAGVSLVVDGIDELGWSRANEIVTSALAVTQRWAGSTVLLTTRPFPESLSGVRTVPLVPLDEGTSHDLIRRIAGPNIQPWALYRLPAPVAESVRLPLFAILLGVHLRSGGGALGGAGDLLALAAQWTVKGLVSSTRGEELMRALAVRIIDGGGKPVPSAAITASISELSALHSTRVLVEQDGHLSFALPMLAQLFAGRSILSGEVEIQDLIDDEGQLQRWLPAIAMAVQVSDSAAGARILGPIAQRRPAYLPAILTDAKVASHLASSREADACASELQGAMRSLNIGWQPLSPVLIPQRRDGSVGAVGIALHDNWLTVSWNRDAQADVDRLPLPSFQDGRPWPVGWGAVRGGETKFDATWAWRWCIEDIQSALRSLLEAKADAIAPLALRSELEWTAAIELTGRGRLDPGPIPISEIRERFAFAMQPDYEPEMARWPLRHQWLYASMFAVETAGIESFASPYPGRDLHVPTGGWVWGYYSAEQLRKRAQAVFLTAMNAYQELVDVWFAPVASRLTTRAYLPARLVGAIDNDPEIRGMRWHFEPRPIGSSNEAVVTVRKGAGRIPLTDGAPFLELEGALRRLRPQAAGWVHPQITEQVLHIYETSPASDLCYDWLSSDLRALSWAK